MFAYLTKVTGGKEDGHHMPSTAASVCNGYLIRDQIEAINHSRRLSGLFFYKQPFVKSLLPFYDLYGIHSICQVNNIIQPETICTGG
jgi:hypothetical protein